MVKRAPRQSQRSSSSGSSRRSQPSSRVPRPLASSSTAIVPWVHPEITDAARLPSKIDSVYSTIKTSLVENWVTQSAALTVFTATSFQVGNLDPDFNSAALIFDQYKIHKIEVELRPHATAPSSVAPSAGQLVTVIDYDDATNLTTTPSALAYANAISTPVYLPQRRCFVPRMAVAAYAGAFTSFANFAPQWIDCASNTVQFYGLKTALDAGNAGSLQVFDLVIRAHISFRSTR